MSLRRTLLQLLATVAIPACFNSGTCPDRPSGEGATELVEPLDTQLQELVDTCRAAGGFGNDCDQLCLEVIRRELGEAPDDANVLNQCDLIEDTDGTTPRTATVEWAFGQCLGGRRPASYAEGGCVPARAKDRTVGAYFAEQARLEAASVRAFLELATALAAHGAPKLLVQACRRAAAEELVHAVLVGKLAVRFGVAPQFHEAAPAPVPSLEALAHANAIEGCMRETWGAMVATWQGRASHDPEVRSVMQRIAIEETKHATISRAIDRWAMRRLDASARERIATARARAFAELATTIAADVPDALIRVAGLPHPEAGAMLFAAMHAAGVV